MASRRQESRRGEAHRPGPRPRRAGQRSPAPPIGTDAASRFLPVVVALVVFLAAMSLAALVLLGVAVDRWEGAFAGALTVQVPAAADDAATDAQVAAAASVLQGMPGIASVEVVSRERTAELLSPWLGDDIDVEDLPLPRLIALRTADGVAADVPALEQAIANAAPGATVDDHGVWLGRLVAYARGAELVAVAVLVLVGGVALVTVVSLTVVRLAIHREVIDILHLLGASDGFVARQFERSAFRLGVGGGLVGTLAAAGAVLMLGRVPLPGLGAADPAALPHMPLEGWLAIAAMPLAAGIVALVTARMTVLIRLGRHP